jgi:hypothetical protein
MLVLHKLGTCASSGFIGVVQVTAKYCNRHQVGVHCKHRIEPIINRNILHENSNECLNSCHPLAAHTLSQLNRT